ncbi:MAG: DUF4250 domain-containing protein [Clostridiales bacterium]|nr:DUF4250 domain-containing protein [Clostridiales bacterium]MCD7830132.1 DUF4250 domain-containing protein [Clostridiales bacterium]MCD7886008.1 DUF4250 domain-containing protein [Clostridiales bacterium]MCD8334254.1 DUF4250 domain-containing protein [Clostridiales bacterium]
MNIPNDPVILLSYLNTQLRDNYSSLTEFCKANCVDEGQLRQKLSLINYEYSPERNQFV